MVVPVTGTLFVLILRALAQKKSICAQKLVQNLRWKRLCAKFNARENYFMLFNSF